MNDSSRRTRWTEQTRRRLLAGAGAALAPAAAGCWGDSGEEGADDGDEGAGGSGANETDDADPAASPSQTATVAARTDTEGTRFDPQVAWIEVGGTVTWEVASGAHSVTPYHPDNGDPRRVPEGAAAFDSGRLEAGERFEWTFETEGVHGYYCEPHRGVGMVGAVIVGDPDPASEPGLAEPGDEVQAADAIADLNGTVVATLGAGPGGAADGADDAGDGADWGDAADDGDAAGDQDDVGDGRDGGSADESGDATVAAEVDIPGERFDPALVEVGVGDAVRWIWGESGHTVTAYDDRIPDAAAGFDSGFREEGAEFVHAFDVEGVYDYYCQPHRSGGMVGSVVVGDPDPAGQPGLSEPGAGGEEGSSLSSLNSRAEERLAGDGGSGDGRGYDVVYAEDLQDVDGVIDVEVRGTVSPGATVTVIARFEGSRLAHAQVDVEGDRQGATDDVGEFEATVPGELEPGEECRFEVEIDDADGRIEVPVE